MSIRPIAFDESSQVYTMFHDEMGHEFDIALSEIEFMVGIDSQPIHTHFIVSCLVPECGSASYHPVSGGSTPPEIQLLASRLVELKGCPCLLVPAGEPTEVNLAHSKLHCAQIDGLGRWQVEANIGPSLDLLIKSGDNYVVGLGPIETDSATYAVVNVGEEILERALNQTYSKLIDGKIEKAGKPNAG